jgi:hypothetical protein
MTFEADNRLSAEEAMLHPWFYEVLADSEGENSPIRQNCPCTPSIKTEQQQTLRFIDDMAGNDGAALVN